MAVFKEEFGVNTAKAEPGDFDWEGNLDYEAEEDRGGTPTANRKLADHILFPVDAPNCITNTIFTWSESEGAEGWARETLLRYSLLLCSLVHQLSRLIL